MAMGEYTPPRPNIVLLYAPTRLRIRTTPTLRGPRLNKVEPFSVWGSHYRVRSLKRFRRSSFIL